MNTLNPVSMMPAMNPTRSLVSRLGCCLLGLACFALSATALAATDGAAVAATIIARGDAAVAAYDPANRLATGSEFSSLYFDVFEGAGMELDLGMKAPGLKTDLEVLFGMVNGKAMHGVPPAELQSAWQTLRDKLQEAAALYDKPVKDEFVTVLLKSFLILFREGLEAMLVVSALAAYLRRAGAADRLWVIYAGVGLAVPLSLLTGWALTGVLQAAGASRALLEGVTMLLAAAVLFYVSFWLFSKSEAKRWQAWIAGQLDSALSQGSVLALGGAACLAVYREGAETVLFYGALASGSPDHSGAIMAGIGVASALLLVAYLMINRLSLRLPYPLFFGGTAVLLYGLGIVFLGQGIIELQAAGDLLSTHLSGAPQIAWLGIAPTLQGLGAQGAMLAIPLLAWLWQRSRRR